MENVDVFDGAGRFTGKVVERHTPLELGEFTKVVHIWIMNSKGEALIQKRSEHVLLEKGTWGVTGGGVLAGETPDETVQRELKEELGISLEGDALVEKKLYVKPFFLVYVYFYKAEFAIDSLTLDPTEVACAEWAAPSKIRYLLRKKKFFSYTKAYKTLLLPHIDLL